jgi:hypothetical protein
LAAERRLFTASGQRIGIKLAPHRGRSARLRCDHAVDARLVGLGPPARGRAGGARLELNDENERYGIIIVQYFALVVNRSRRHRSRRHRRRFHRRAWSAATWESGDTRAFWKTGDIVGSRVTLDTVGSPQNHGLSLHYGTSPWPEQRAWSSPKGRTTQPSAAPAAISTPRRRAE